MGKALVIAGAGHAHMTLMKRLGEICGRGHRVTVISPSPHHYYSGMGPGMLSGIYHPGQLRFNIRRMAEERGASFVEESVTGIAPDERKVILSSGDAVSYDVASFNTGSGIDIGRFTGPGEGIIPVKPIINLYHARQAIGKRLGQEKLGIAVVGGGPAGVEIAANLWRLVDDSGHGAHITLVGGERILPSFPPRVRELALRSLDARGIKVIEGNRARDIQGGEVTLADGGRLRYDYLFLAVGVRPSTIFSDSGLPVGEDGGMLVDHFLRSTRYPQLFGGGDCISLAGNPLAKVGVYAVRQNNVLFHNVLAALEGGEPRRFEPGGDYLLIMNMGDGRGIVWKRGMVLDGRLAFLLKDYIDRRFMSRFQLSGETGDNDV